MLGPSAFRTLYHPVILLTVTSRLERNLEGHWVLISMYYSEQAGLHCSTKFPPESFQFNMMKDYFLFKAILFMWKQWLGGPFASLRWWNISAWTVSSAWMEVSDTALLFHHITLPDCQGAGIGAGTHGYLVSKNMFSIQNSSNPHLTRPEKQPKKVDRQDLQINRPIQFLSLYLEIILKQKDNSSFSFCTREIYYWLLTLVCIHIPLPPAPVNLMVFIFSLKDLFSTW